MQYTYLTIWHEEGDAISWMWTKADSPQEAAEDARQRICNNTGLTRDDENSKFYIDVVISVDNRDWYHP